MAFKNLEQRYTERSKDLYAAATLKFDGGKASIGSTDDPLIVRKPGDGYWGFGEGRGLPVRSAAQDVTRLTRFSLSNRGILFLAKQQLLQTGNTFARTRLLNPTFAILNAVPFVRTQRHANVSSPSALRNRVVSSNSILQDIFGRPVPISNTELKKLGTLQQETYEKLLPVTKSGEIKRDILSRIPVISQLKGISQLISNTPVNRPEIANGKEQYFIGRLLTSNSTNSFKFGGTIGIPPKYNMLAITNDENTSAYLIDGSRDSGDYRRISKIFLYGQIFRIPTQTETRRQELLSKAAKDTKLFKFSDQGLVNSVQKTQREYQDSVREYFKTEYNEDTTLYIKYFGGNGIRQLTPSSKDGVPSTTGTTSNPVVDKKISYIKDPLNLPSKTPIKRLSVNTPSIYDNLPTTGSVKNDIINVSFAMSSDAPVQFRAFVSNINEQSTPQYKEYQYIGRVERYISYVSVKRQVSFKLVIVAYSDTELQTVWKKINYLTSLTYPYNVYKGILQPNIVKLSLGNIYTDQPGYVTSIRSDFGGNISSWDIDKQVPHGATVDINFDIIEKRGVTTAGTKLYGILQTEGTGQQPGPQNITPTIVLPQPTFI
jgi:hypothetical protein